MPRVDYKRCRNCGQPDTVVGELSHTRLCAICGVLIENENALQISAGRGPFARHRAMRQIMQARRVLVDDAAGGG